MKTTLVTSIAVNPNENVQNFNSDLQEVCDDMNRAGYEFITMYPMQETDRVPLLNGQPRIKTSFTCVFTSFED
jgi:hypothetical protein